MIGPGRLHHGIAIARPARLVGVLLAVFVSASTTLPAGNAGEVVASVQAWIDATRDLECDFVQTLESGALGSGLRERGHLLLRRPGRLRWEYTDPEPKTALLLGNRTLLYLPEERQLLRGKVSEEEGLLPVLLAGERRLAEVFDASLASSPSSGGGSAFRLRLVPRQRPEGFEEVTLTVRPPHFAIDEAEVLDGMGNRTRYEFRNVRRNRGLSEAAFSFEPPPGTEIIDQ